ncbi:MAG: DUF433 domain-containing protein [Planctomycetes bacterium]|nr:DUF433 domain-containing protein [Planctomycetota bacterium]
MKPQKTEQVPLRVDDDGTLRVGETQVTLDVVMAAYDQGATPEQIVQKFGELALGDVYAVIGYSLRHEAEVLSYLETRRAAADKLRADIQREAPTKRFRERLLRMKRDRGLSGGGA